MCENSVAFSESSRGTSLSAMGAGTFLPDFDLAENDADEFFGFGGSCIGTGSGVGDDSGDGDGDGDDSGDGVGDEVDDDSEGDCDEAKQASNKRESAGLAIHQAKRLRRSRGAVKGTGNCQRGSSYSGSYSDSGSDSDSDSDSGSDEYEEVSFARST